jgi:hypothetical protein
MGFRGNRGDTQGQPYDNEHGRPLSMLIRRATGRYKETKFYRVGKGVGFAYSTACISRKAKPWEREGAILLSFFRRSEGKGIAQSVLETPEKIRELQRKLYRKSKQGSMGESHRMKIIGKPYSGKPNVRFDEGELEIELLANTPALYSTEVVILR